jgi:hypothetical protein
MGNAEGGIRRIGFGILSIWDCFDLGFGIADLGFKGKAHGA